MGLGALHIRDGRFTYTQAKNEHRAPGGGQKGVAKSAMARLK